MPPKQRITREMILETSFAMFCHDGMEVVNARSVAKALNCSTQPIFSYFAGMDDLKSALENKASALFEAEIAAAMESDSPLFDSCMAYFRFALQQPNLFRQMFLIKQEKCPESLTAVNEFLRRRVVIPLAERTGEDAAQAEARCVKLWVFTHGLASLTAMGLLDVSDESAERMLREAERSYALVGA